MPYWTQQEDETMRALVAQGKTPSQMREFFPDKTRNSIIGRVHRNGLGGNAPKRKPRASKPPKSKGPQRIYYPRLFGCDEDRKEPKTNLKCFSDKPAKKETKTLVRLKPGDCRWVYDYDGEARFCVESKAAGSYCQRHALIVYRPSDKSENRSAV